MEENTKTSWEHFSTMYLFTTKQGKVCGTVNGDLFYGQQGTARNLGGVAKGQQLTKEDTEQNYPDYLLQSYLI